ncbi:hypothetical protein BH20CHL6_BH20CHL6_12380 [soil metagenome]
MLCVDEKTKIQALDRTQPLLPLRPGQAERHTHDYTRHGTTCLFAALEVGTGQVTTDTRARHTGADFLAFLRRVARAYPDGELHVVLGSVSTHKTPEVQACLERHSHITFHFTPTSAPWMNQVETWFGILTRQSIRRGSFRSVKELYVIADKSLAWTCDDRVGRSGDCGRVTPQLHCPSGALGAADGQLLLDPACGALSGRSYLTLE